MVDSLTVPASLHDCDGRFLHVNPAAERASGRSNDEWRGRHFTEPLPPEQRRQVREHFRRAAEDGEATDFETVFFDADGILRGVRAQHLPLRSSDEIVGVLILAYGAPAPDAPGVLLRPQLTARQREILTLMAAGRSTADIAGALTLSGETVRNHVRNVLRELHVHTRVEAVAAGRRLGLLNPQPLESP